MLLNFITKNIEGGGGVSRTAPLYLKGKLSGKSWIKDSFVYMSREKKMSTSIIEFCFAIEQVRLHCM